MKFFKGENSGNIVTTAWKVTSERASAGDSFSLLEPNTSEGAHEKHLPVIKIKGSTVRVEVGSAEHPMLDAHYITFIALETKKGFQKKNLKPGDVPAAEFALTADDVPLAAYEYCNLHGLWKTPVKSASSISVKPRMLITYFSAGGTTAAAARKLADEVHADLYEIRPETPYTAADLDWTDKGSRSTAEMTDPSARPAISGEIPALSRYDTVLIGYPIWWGTAPRIINTFLETADLAGKTVVPFATSGGNSISKSEDLLQEQYPDQIKWHAGRLLSKSPSADEIRKWLADLIWLPDSDLA